MPIRIINVGTNFSQPQLLGIDRHIFGFSDFCFLIPSILRSSAITPPPSLPFPSFSFSIRCVHALAFSTAPLFRSTPHTQIDYSILDALPKVPELSSSFSFLPVLRYHNFSSSSFTLECGRDNITTPACIAASAPLARSVGGDGSRIDSQNKKEKKILLLS